MQRLAPRAKLGSNAADRMTALNHPLEAGTVIASKYRVDKSLSQNGTGLAWVYVAWHELLQQNVALKILSPELASEAEVTSRFLNEARAAVRLRNEHVAAVMDVGTADDGTPYIVLEHLEGENLETILEKRGPLPVKEVVDWVLQALEAVAHAHAQRSFIATSSRASCSSRRSTTAPRW